MNLALLAVGAVMGLVIGVPAGWTSNGVYRAHLDIKRTKAAIPGMRKHRWARIKAAFGTVVVVVLIGAVAVAALAHRDDTRPAGPSPSPSVQAR